MCVSGTPGLDFPGTAGRTLPGIRGGTFCALQGFSAGVLADLSEQSRKHESAKILSAEGSEGCIVAGLLHRLAEDASWTAFVGRDGLSR